MNKRLLIWISVAVLGMGAGLAGYYFFFRRPDTALRTRQVIDWINYPEKHPEWNAGEPGTRCGTAPFIFPTHGFIGYLRDDSWKIGHRHQGIDIFGGTDPGKTPVVNVYDGYLTRQTDWKSSLILRIPSDPLQPGRQIWVYYTHLADPQGNSLIDSQFPAGTFELPIKAGTLLGHQGNYSGDPSNPVGVHLHLSVVKDNGQGKYLNELDIDNTLDPSPYFGLALNAHTNQGIVPVCPP
jgi:hypothetical protein